MMAAPRLGNIEWLMLIALSIVWGGSFFFVEVALDHMGPLTIVAFRVMIGAAGLVILVGCVGPGLPRGLAIWRDLAVMALLNNVVPFSLISWGQTHIDSGTASILNATTPFFTVFIAHFLTADEKLTGPRIAGIGIGVVGTAVLVGPAQLFEFGATTLGQIAVLGAAISYGLAGVWGKRRLAGLAPTASAAGMLIASSAMMLPLAIWAEGVPTIGAWVNTWPSLVGVGLLSTALAYLLYFRILATAGASNLLLVTMLVPVSAVLLGALVLGESVTINATIGMGLIAVGLVVIDGRMLKAWRGRLGPAVNRE